LLRLWLAMTVFEYFVFVKKKASFSAISD